jgi:ribosomal protein L29
MELEIYEAFISAGINEAKAKAAVESINKEIDKRYSLHADQLATRGDIENVRRDLAEAKTDIIKWALGSIFVAVGLFATIMKAFS